MLRARVHHINLCSCVLVSICVTLCVLRHLVVCLFNLLLQRRAYGEGPLVQSCDHAYVLRLFWCIQGIVRRRDYIWPSHRPLSVLQHPRCLCWAPEVGAVLSTPQ